MQEAPNPERFETTSVYYAATMFEARMCERDPIVARHAAGVRLLVREDSLSRTMPRYQAVEIERHPGSRSC
ncbi:hypothetical protein [Herbidospora cretacea]|uniref:hypothetical protein n=1 Tax=Herbidospora cretacea TaxID=28444 RepID=UPI0004C3A9F5|nr:hypothetical protein [Herbidospora cretacea]